MNPSTSTVYYIYLFSLISLSQTPVLLVLIQYSFSEYLVFVTRFHTTIRTTITQFYSCMEMKFQIFLIKNNICNLQVVTPNSLVSRHITRNWRRCWLSVDGMKGLRASLLLWPTLSDVGSSWGTSWSSCGRTTSMDWTSTGSTRPTGTAANLTTGRTTQISSRWAAAGRVHNFPTCLKQYVKRTYISSTLDIQFFFPKRINFKIN